MCQIWSLISLFQKRSFNFLNLWSPQLSASNESSGFFSFEGFADDNFCETLQHYCTDFLESMCWSWHICQTLELRITCRPPLCQPPLCSFNPVGRLESILAILDSGWAFMFSNWSDTKKISKPWNEHKLRLYKTQSCVIWILTMFSRIFQCRCPSFQTFSESRELTGYSSLKKSRAARTIERKSYSAVVAG